MLIRRFLNYIKGRLMKQDVVTAQIAAIQQAQQQALVDAIGAAYDQGAADQKAIDPVFSQADVDQAVAKAVAAAQAVDAQTLAAAQADAAAKLADVQAKLDAMSAKEQGEEQVIAGLQASLASAKSSIEAVFALLPQAAQVAAPAAAQDSAPQA